MQYILEKTFLVIFDSLFCWLAVALILLFFPSTAYAYVDPSIITYSIQALAGVAVALSAVVGVAWRKLRKHFYRVLKIDENADRIIEQDFKPIFPEDKNEVDDCARKEGLASEESLKRSNKRVIKLKWSARLCVSAAVSLLFAFTLLFVAPCEMVAANAKDLVFGLQQIWPVMAIFALVVFLAMAFILSLFRSNAFNIIIACIFAFALCCLLQSLFLNYSLPAADGRVLDLSNYKKITLLSCIVWIFVFVIILILSQKKPTFSSIGIPISCFVLIIVQGVGLFSLFASSQPGESGNESVETVTVTEEGLFDVSSKSNVVVFVLDTTDNKDFVRIVKEYPEYFDTMTGATLFTDVVGSMIPTRYALPSIISGNTIGDYDSFQEYYQNRYIDSEFIPSIVNAGYSVGLYSPNINDGAGVITPLTINVHGLETETIEQSIDYFGTIGVLTQCALYRDMPWPLKQFFYFYTDDINKGFVKHIEQDNPLDSEPYIIDDIKYYNELISIGLKIEDNNDYKGAFRLIHLKGSHEPYNMDENVVYVGEDASDLVSQTLGSIRIVDAYIDQLKKLGLYDQTTLIITSDHGDWELLDDGLYEATNPIMIVKPAQSISGYFDGPMRISDIPVSHSQLQASVLDAMDVNHDVFGDSIFESDLNEDKTRYFYATCSEATRDYFLLEYAVEGNSSDFNNWTLTGRKWEWEDPSPVS